MNQRKNNERISGIYVWKLGGVPKYVGQSINIEYRMYDTHKDSTSKYYRVSKTIRQNKYVYWEVVVRINGKKNYIGTYKNEIMAAIAYNNYIIDNSLPNPLNII